MNIAHDTLREVIVNYAVDCFEVNSSAHKICADKNPNLSHPEILHDLISLSLLPICMNHICVNSIIHQFMIKFLRPFLTLYEYKHGRLEPISDDLPQCGQFPILFPHIHNLLINCCCGSVSQTNLHF